MKLTTRSLPTRLVLSLTGLTLTSLVFAQAPGRTSNSMSANGAGQSYIGLNAGSADLSLSGKGFGNIGTDGHGTSYSVMMGNYFLNQNVGVEIGYTDFGSANRAGGSTKVDAINLSFIGRLPVNDSFNLLGKVGTAYGRTDVTSSASSGVTAGSERGFDWSYGVGAELLFTPQWSGVLQYDEQYMKFPGSVRERVSNTSLGLRYRY